MQIRTLAAPALVCLLALGACSDTLNEIYREAGAEVDEGNFGTPTLNNSLLMMGELEATQAMQGRFAAEVPPSIGFDFDSAAISAEAAAVLEAQADWIRQFPEIRFRVYGHTDLVGTDAYNKALGLRRANAVVAFLATRGISRSRLEAVVSLGETQPVVPTPDREPANRRTVTEVTGFVKNAAGVTSGKYIEVVWREYVQGATRIHPQNTPVKTAATPDGGG